MSDDWEEVREVSLEEGRLLERLDQKLTEGASQYGDFNRRYLIRRTIGLQKIPDLYWIIIITIQILLCIVYKTAIFIHVKLEVMKVQNNYP